VENSPSQPERDIIRAKIRTFIHQLQEHHLMNVRIFVTKSEGGNCYALNEGGGDIYSILGAVDEWLIQQREASRQQVRQIQVQGEDE
jgi:hypothetical protein